ncbi:hypothetical protein [Methanonatronarchaeum sp. AMET-Sl]|uniref:hypothetical protein n=1 Tax=Methanonatronarchaeum sp. AMET-Sl TaxID=3037654 RepID=UPI00244E56E9|nr:hypothetical protein [Methanonatronarchaeum sp. AMET-Sl]WGI17947.1 hypothetical protein QEN48_02785 [Methanonatronarchaeum sp. AMET-Sl]
MVESGIFVTLYDKETLDLYLDKGVYGQHMPPEDGQPSSYSNYYRVLGDYACCRENDHVFFFLKRKIYYGGQIKGSKEKGAFHINGQHSPMGRKANAKLVWNESKREIYEETDTPGVFKVNDKKRCQPFIITFKDKQNLKGRYITSDKLYFKLGEYPYPLPSNSIQGMGFCTITPGETQTLLNLLKKPTTNKRNPQNNENIKLNGKPTPYKTEYTIKKTSEAEIESQLEAALTANPKLLPPKLQPPKKAAICRQTPISPFKPSQMDKADITIYTEKQIRDGTIPNTVIELKNDKAGKQAAEQIKRYHKWLHKRLGNEANKIDIHILAKDYTKTFNNYLPPKTQKQIQKHKLTDTNNNQETLNIR